MERMDKYNGCVSEWWLGFGLNKARKRYCKNCGWTSDLKVFNPYTEEYEQWLPRYCPDCGFRNYMGV